MLLVGLRADVLHGLVDPLIFVLFGNLDKGNDRLGRCFVSLGWSRGSRIIHRATDRDKVGRLKGYVGLAGLGPHSGAVHFDRSIGLRLLGRLYFCPSLGHGLLGQCDLVVGQLLALLRLGISRVLKSSRC